MKRPLLVAAGLAVCGLVTACGGAGGATPTAPTGPPSTQAAAPPPPHNPAARSAATGTISFLGSSPGFGASLLVGDCRFGNVTRSCADGWRGTFQVSLDRDMVWAVLSVAFYEGPVNCGYAADVLPLVPAGQAGTFRPSWISLSDEFGTFPSPCRLPATTTRMVAALWSDADWTTQLTQEFSGSYTFIRP
jgi:hypothetical protein